MESRKNVIMKLYFLITYFYGKRIFPTQKKLLILHLVNFILIRVYCWHKLHLKLKTEESATDHNRLH